MDRGEARRKLAALDAQTRAWLWAVAHSDDETEEVPVIADVIPVCGHRGQIDAQTGLCLVCAEWRRRGLLDSD